MSKVPEIFLSYTSSADELHIKWMTCNQLWFATSCHLLSSTTQTFFLLENVVGLPNFRLRAQQEGNAFVRGIQSGVVKFICQTLSALWYKAHWIPVKNQLNFVFYVGIKFISNFLMLHSMAHLSLGSVSYSGELAVISLFQTSLFQHISQQGGGGHISFPHAILCLLQHALWIQESYIHLLHFQLLL